MKKPLKDDKIKRKKLKVLAYASSPRNCTENEQNVLDKLKRKNQNILQIAESHVAEENFSTCY